MKQLAKHKDEILHYKLKNISGGDIDLTDKTVNWVMIDQSGTTIIEKKNDLAGGDDSELKVINTTSGIIVVYIDANDTKSLTDSNFINNILVDGSSEYQESILLYGDDLNHIQSYYKNTGVSTDKPIFDLGTHIGFQYFSTDLGVWDTWDGSAWVSTTTLTENRITDLESQHQRGSLAERDALGLTLGTDDFCAFYVEEEQTTYFWSGTSWV